MYIRSLELRDYRSWPELNLELEPGITVFIGRNGFGKTNIVEAIGYLAHLSSHRVSTDALWSGWMRQMPGFPLLRSTRAVNLQPIS